VTERDGAGLVLSAARQVLANATDRKQLAAFVAHADRLALSAHEN
jgi:hypothetical protein